MSRAEDHRGQNDDEQQAGQDIAQHVNHEAGSGPAVRHGPSLPTRAYIQIKEVFSVAFLFLTLVLAGLAYAGWRLTRLTAARPTTRVIGPDDDPDFLRRLGPGDHKPRP
jgi:hypothetical protein